MVSDEQVLSSRALNRALLARQGLLARSDAGALETIEGLVGMQAQVPRDPYLALWSRLKEFDPEELSALIADRRAVRTGVMRGTIHLVSDRDALAMHPLTLPILARAFKSPFEQGLAGADPHEVTAAGVELMAERPRTRSELSALLARRWPHAERASVGWCVSSHAPVVQVPPRGLWRATGQATLATVPQWLGRELEPEPSVADLVSRYLAAFGPASVADARTWSGLTGLREVFEELRPRLRVFRDERGRELFDVPDAPLPAPRTAAPPRFLPQFDNVLLSHDDRSRVIPAGGPGLPIGGTPGTLLVDGFARTTWNLAQEDDTATLTIEGLTAQPGDPPETMDAVEAEGRAMLAFLVPEATERHIRW